MKTTKTRNLFIEFCICPQGHVPDLVALIYVLFLSIFSKTVKKLKRIIGFFDFVSLFISVCTVSTCKKVHQRRHCFSSLSFFLSAVPALLKPPGEDSKGSAPRPHSVYRKKPTVQRSHTQREEPAASAEARKKRVPHAEKEVRGH